MQVGDLVKFLDGGVWTEDLAGKIGVVVAIRQVPASRPRRHEWDCYIGGELQAGFSVRLDDPGYLKRYGVKVLSKVCNP